MENQTHSEAALPQPRLVRLAGYRVTVNRSPAEIVDGEVRWQRALGYFSFREEHGGQWSQDGLTWWIDGKTIRFSEPNVSSQPPVAGD